MGFGIMGFGVMGFGVMGFGVMGFGIMGFGIMGFGVMGFCVMGFCVMGFGVMGFCVMGFGVMGFCVMGFGVMGFPRLMCAKLRCDSLVVKGLCVIFRYHMLSLLPCHPPKEALTRNYITFSPLSAGTTKVVIPIVIKRTIGKPRWNM